MLPEELILFVQKNVNDYTTLTNLKMSCTYFNKVITQFSLAKLMHNKIDVYKIIFDCININCKQDTFEFYRPILVTAMSIQDWTRVLYCADALNKSRIKINHKYYNVCSPYCKECFIKNILIGDNTNARVNYSGDEDDVDYDLNVDY